VYNLALGVNIAGVPNRSELGHNLHSDLVLDSFILHGLLRYKDMCTENLVLPHAGLQRHQFDGALDKLNYHMARMGQEMWAHACYKCMKFYRGLDGKICV
jgi:hypothetical protein